MVSTPEAVAAPAGGVTPWVLLLVRDGERRTAIRQACEAAGFAVEVVTNARDALDCLKVITPSLVVIEDKVYRPAPR